MAITNAQQYKQLLAKGGRIGFQGGGKDSGSTGSSTGDGPAGGASAGGNYGGDSSGGTPDKGLSNTGGNLSFGDRVIDVAQRQRRDELRNLANMEAGDKLEEQLERFRDLNSRSRQFTNFISKFSPFAKIAAKFGPLNNKDYFTSKMSPQQLQDFANLEEEEKEDKFGTFMDEQRNRFTDDGNEGGNEGVNQMIPVDTTFAQAPSIVDQEPVKEEEPFEMSRRFRAEGGIMNTDVVGGEMDFESARQMYGLGKLVKKVTRSVKKIAKSPIGKAALLYTVGGGLGSIAGGGTFFGNFMSPMNQLRGVGSIFSKGGLENIMSKAKLGKFVTSGGSDLPIFEKNFLGKALTSPTGIIAGTSLVSGLLTAAQEKEAQQISDETGIPIDTIRANPDKYLARRFRAEGGSMDEPVAKKTMPLLDMGGQEMDLRAEGGFVPLGRMEKADDVPARLSKNEFVFTADAVRNAGEGDVDKGAEVMYNMMKNLESGGDVSEESQGLDGAREMFQTSQRLGEVI